MRNVSDKSFRENQNAQFMINNVFLNHAVYDIMWKSIVEPHRPQITKWHMRFSCWIPKATNAHSEYVIIIDFPLQQFLHERASMLRYTYICLPCSFIFGHIFPIN